MRKLLIVLIFSLFLCGCSWHQTIEPIQEQIEIPAQQVELDNIVEFEAEVQSKPTPTFDRTKIKKFPKPQLFSPDITYSYEYVANGEVMNHVLFSPSTNDKNLPLIVFLHGSGEVWGNPADFLLRGIIPAMENWTLEGFNAYVLCPHLTGDFGYQYWGSDFCETNLRNLIAWIDEQKNIDTNQIYLMGASLGGAGAQYMAHELGDVFSKCVVLSGYPTTIPIAEIQIPIIGYVGTVGCGEHIDSVRYMRYTFATTFGEDKMFEVPASHGGLPTYVLNEDKDGNNRSDVIEWLFSKFEN